MTATPQQMSARRYRIERSPHCAARQRHVTDGKRYLSLLDFLRDTLVRLVDGRLSSDLRRLVGVKRRAIDYRLIRWVGRFGCIWYLECAAVHVCPLKRGRCAKRP